MKMFLLLCVLLQFLFANSAITAGGLESSSPAEVADVGEQPSQLTSSLQSCELGAAWASKARLFF
jgi:hypothetical protein